MKYGRILLNGDNREGRYMKSDLGYSLIEVLLVITIVGAIVILLTQSLISTTRISTKVEVTNTVKQSGDFAIRILEQHMMTSKQIASSCNGNASPTLSTVDINGRVSTFQCAFDTSNNVNRIASVSGSTTLFLTPENVTLGGANCNDSDMSLLFVCTSTPGRPNVTRIQFSLSQAGLPVDQFERGSISFQTTVSARN